MKRWTRPVLILTVAATMTAAGTYLAYASWFVPSKQTQIRITSATMPRGVTPTVAGSSDGVLVSWRAQEIGPGARMQSYTLTAHSVRQPPLPPVTHSVTSTGRATESIDFPYRELGVGGWYWTLAPRFQSWVGPQSERSGQVTFAMPTRPPMIDLAAGSPAAAAEPPLKTSPRTVVPDQSPVLPDLSPSPSSTANSTIPVLPLPSDSAEPLTPPSAANPVPPPPLDPEA